MSRLVTLGQRSAGRFAGNNARVQDTRGETACVVEFVIDEVAVSLDHDAAARMSEVENLVGASRTPPSAGGTGLQLLPA
jgi:hypothetical protein